MQQNLAKNEGFLPQENEPSRQWLLLRNDWEAGVYAYACEVGLSRSKVNFIDPWGLEHVREPGFTKPLSTADWSQAPPEIQTAFLIGGMLTIGAAGEWAIQALIGWFETHPEEVEGQACNIADHVKHLKQLASEEQMEGPYSRTIEPFRDAEEIAETYGGEASDWIKVSSDKFVAPDGTVIETHWVENIETGQRILQKTKINP